MIKFADVNDFAEYLAEKLCNRMEIGDDSVYVFDSVSVEQLTEINNEVEDFSVSIIEDFIELTFN